jgi:amino acid adenylation domain-containing protein
LSGQSDFVVGSPTTGRTRSELAGLVGYFVNPVALHADLSGEPSFVEHLERVRQTTLNAFEHQDYPFPLVVEHLHPVRDPSRSPVFQTMFSVEKSHRLRDQGIARFVLDAPGTRMTLGGLELEAHPIAQRAAQFDLSLTLVEDQARLIGAFEYDSALFEPATVERYANVFATLLESIVGDPRQRVDRLRLLMEDDQRHLLAREPGGAPLDGYVHELIARRANATPDALAVIDGERWLSCAELDRHANALAHSLRQLGVGPESLVGLCMARSVDQYVAILGILKAGGAYVPLDPTYPDERLSFTVSDTGMRMVVTQPQFAERFQTHDVRVAYVDPDAVAEESPAIDLHADNAAYVIYTSGSTGTPKGVVVSHAAVAHHAVATVASYQLCAPDRVLQFASLAFDVAAEEIFPTLVAGASIVLPDAQAPTALTDLNGFIEKHSLTVVNLPAPYWHAWVAELARSGAQVASSLRLMVTGSDAVSPDRLAIWQELVRGGVGFRNAYGPTEATITATVYEPSSAGVGPHSTSVPIGTPLGQSCVYVLDQHLQPVPHGVRGGLYIGGPGLARGYLGRPALTAAAFIPDPFGNTPGGRLYDTGDQARWHADGVLEFLGRRDDQVKIRGFRIEPGEVEAVLARHPGVRQVAVIGSTPPRGEARLVAYVVPAEAELSTEELRQFVATQLPPQMIPSVFANLARLPMTTGGKVDRRALPAPDAGRATQATFAAPRSELERTIAAIWGDVLQLDQVGTEDSFFDLGGHSLLALEAHAMLQKRLNREIPVVELFHYPTIRALASFLDQPAAASPTETNGHSRARVRQQLMQQRHQLRASRTAILEESHQ